MAVYNNRIVINSGNTFTLDTGDIVHNTTTVAGHGAGINNAGLLIADGATFYANSTTDTTTYGGGALYNSGTATLTNVLFDSNHAKHTGGSIQNVAGNVTVTGSTFTHNNSANCALYNTNGGYMTIKDCIFNGESPRAIYSDGDTVVTIIDGCQFLTSHDGILNENSTIILRGNNVINANFQNTGSRNKYWYLEGATFTFASQEASVSLPVLLTERNDGLQALVFDNKYTVSFYSSQTAFDTVAITISDNALASAQLSGTLNLATNLTVTNPTYYVDDQAVVLGSTFSKGDGSYVLTHSNGVLNLTATQETFPVTVVNTKSAANYSDGLTSLSEAISRTSVGGTVTFDASINGQRLEPETISIAKNLTIDGNGREQTLLQNNISVGSATTVSINNVHNLGARFDNNSGGVLNVSSVTIQNASGSSIGQAILNNYNSVLTVTGSTFGGNVTSASFGGGIANYNSGNNTATITDSLFINNRSQHCGGAVANWGAMTIDGATFTANTASNGHGGAIYNSANGVLTLRNTLFDSNGNNNSVALNKGAMYVDGTSTVYMENVTFLTSKDSVYNENSAITMSGTMTLNANMVVNSYNLSRYYVHDADLVFGGTAGINLATFTETGTGVKTMTFANTGTVQFASGQNFNNLAITITDTAMTAANSLGSFSIATNLGASTASFYYNDSPITMGETIIIGDNGYQVNFSNGALTVAVAAESDSTIVDIADADLFAFDNHTSLTEAFTAATASAIVTFDSTLNGATVSGTNSLSPAKALTIEGNGTAETLLNVPFNFNYDTTLRDLTVTGDGSRIIINNGTTTLDNVDIKDISGRATGLALVNNSHLGIHGGTVSGIMDGQSASSAVQGAVLFNYATATITNVLFDGNRNFIHGGGALGNSNILVIDGCTFANNRAAYGGALWNQSANGYITVRNSVFSGNTSNDTTSGTIYNDNFSHAIFENCSFLTNTDNILVNKSELTFKGNITLNAAVTTISNETVTPYVYVDGANFTFAGTTAISVATLTETGDGMQSITFDNTGVVNFAEGQTFNNVAITISNALLNTVNNLGSVDVATNFTASTATVNGNAIVSGGTFNVAGDTFKADFDGTLTITSVIVPPTPQPYVFYNSDWTAATIPASIEIGGNTYSLVWKTNAFASLSTAKSAVDDGGTLFIEDTILSGDYYTDGLKTYVHGGTIGNAYASKNNEVYASADLTLDGVALTLTGGGKLLSNYGGTVTGDFQVTLTDMDVDERIYAACGSIGGDVTMNIVDSNFSTNGRIWVTGQTVAMGANSDINVNISGSTIANSMSMSANDESKQLCNDVNIVASDSYVGSLAGSGSGNCYIGGNVSISLTNCEIATLRGSAGNQVNGDVSVTLNASTISYFANRGIVNGDTSISVIGGQSVADRAVTLFNTMSGVDSVQVSEYAVLAFTGEDATITDSTFLASAGSYEVQAGTTVTLAGAVTFNDELTLGAGAALVAADSAVITINTAYWDSAIDTGTGNALVLGADCAAVDTDVAGFAAITFKGQNLSFAAAGQALENMAISIDTNNVWPTGTTVIATSVSSLTDSTFTVNGISTTLGAAMANGAVLEYVDSDTDGNNDTLQLRVTNYKVTAIDGLDAAMADAAQQPGVITFGTEVDGLTCSFGGNTIVHAQIFQGNGAGTTTIQGASAGMTFAEGNEVTMSELTWNGILYGGFRNGGNDSTTSLTFENARLNGNVFGGSRAETNNAITLDNVNLSLNNSTMASGKTIYGGGYANGGTLLINNSVKTTLTEVTANNVYGAGAVSNGGNLMLEAVETTIDGGNYGSVFNGANIAASTSGSFFMADTLTLNISGGTFSGAVGNGCTSREDDQSSAEIAALNISDGLFNGHVYAGLASFSSGTATNAVVGDTRLNITGGTFNKNIFGGNVGQTGAKASNTHVGNTYVVIDTTDSQVYINGNVYGGSMGFGSADDTSVTFTGSGSNLHFGADSYVSGVNEYAYSTNTAVNGSSTLNFVDFTRTFSANLQGPAFDTLKVDGDSCVRFKGAQVNQDLSFVKNWVFEELDGTPYDGNIVFSYDPTIGAYVNPKNDFRGDSISLSFADGGMSDGDDWRLFSATSATLKNWNKLGGIDLKFGDETVQFEKNGAQYGYDIWTAACGDTTYQVSVNSNYDIRLACSISA